MSQASPMNLRQVSSLLVNVMQSRAQLLNKMLDPRRDIDAECGYVADPTPENFNTMYEQEGIARRVVWLWPSECWQNDPEVYETEETSDTPFEAAWKDLVSFQSLYAVLNRVDGLSGIGRFAIILLGLDDNKPLSSPATKATKLLYTRVFDESVTKIVASELDTKSPRFGRPTSYTVEYKATTEGTESTLTVNIHWSRVIHVADCRRMSDVLGESRMRSVFNRLQDIRKLLGGSAEMFWQGAFPGLSFEVDPRFLEFGAVEIDTEALKAQLQDYVNGMQRYLANVGVSVKSLAPQVADPSKHMDQQLRAIALSLGVPYRVFMGTEEAKLASGQDSKTWAKRVNQRQSKYLTPMIIRPLVDRLIELGVLPKPKNPYQVSWPDMLTPSDTEKANVANTLVTAVKTYVQGDCEQLIPPKHFLMRILGLSEEAADIILKDVRKELENHPPEEAQPQLPGPTAQPKAQTEPVEPSQGK